MSCRCDGGVKFVSGVLGVEDWNDVRESARNHGSDRLFIPLNGREKK